MQECGKVFLTLLVIILLPSCGPQKRKSKKAALQKAAFLLSEIETQIDVDQSVVELEAKLTDIPTCIGSRMLTIRQISEQPPQMRLELECDQSLEEVDAFYAEQMLYNGWQQVITVKDDQEIMHVYKKPQKLCIIMMTQITSGQTHLAMTVSDISGDL